MSRVLSDTALNGRRRSDEAKATGRPFLLALFGVFVVIMLASLLMGLQAYRLIAEERTMVDEQRLAYGSLVHTVKAFDAVDAFAVDEYESNDVLSMTQRTTGGTYVMLLYVHDGMLMQQYSVAANAVIAPETAHPLFETGTFRVAYESGLLTLATDAASPSIHLACPQSHLTFGSEQGTRSAEAGDA